jgi:hypothetical protein
VKKLALISILLIFISACVPFDLVGPGNSSRESTSNNNGSGPNIQATVAALLTEQPELHPSATSFQPQPNLNPVVKPTARPTETPLPTAKPFVPTATKTSSAASSFINVTLVQDSDTFGDADVYWDALGEFASGFKVLWSSANSYPTFPGDSNVLISSASARSTTIHAEAGKTFYFRVCRYNNGSCDTYSNVYPFKLASLISPTATAGASITIQKVEGTGTGQAKVSWSVNGSFSNGFKVVWSDNNTAPKYPDDSAVYAGADARSATITGTPGTKYYIRICKYNGSGCDFYSGKVTFTFPETTETVSIEITEMSDKVTGHAYIHWSVTGSCPCGFKITWSSTNPNPVYPPATDELWTYKSDPSARSAIVEGTPGTTYHFRVCQYLDPGCGVYSNSYSFTFASAPEPTVDTSTINLISVEARTPEDPTVAHLVWEAAGSFPNGFKIIWSATNPAPTYPDHMDGYNYLSDPSATTGDTLPLQTGTTYFVRVCKYDVVTAFVKNLGFLLLSPLNNDSITGCTIYSNVLEYTVPTP